MAKMGRPKKEDPFNVRTSVRLDTKTDERLSGYCERHEGMSKAEAIRKAVEQLLANERFESRSFHIVRQTDQQDTIRTFTFHRDPDQKPHKRTFTVSNKDNEQGHESGYRTVSVLVSTPDNNSDDIPKDEASIEETT